MYFQIIILFTYLGIYNILSLKNNIWWLYTHIIYCSKYYHYMKKQHLYYSFIFWRFNSDFSYNSKYFRFLENQKSIILYNNIHFLNCYLLMFFCWSKPPWHRRLQRRMHASSWMMGQYFLMHIWWHSGNMLPLISSIDITIATTKTIITIEFHFAPIFFFFFLVFSFCCEAFLYDVKRERRFFLYLRNNEELILYIYWFSTKLVVYLFNFLWYIFLFFLPLSFFSIEIN